jgi:hypothetical protein
MHLNDDANIDKYLSKNNKNFIKKNKMWKT